MIALKYTAKRTVNTDGQKRMQTIRQLCIKFAQENDDWGYGRIQGALANLGYDVCESMVGNILRQTVSSPPLNAPNASSGNGSCETNYQ
ncbi:hypothetical protein [Cerasicoccus frondis]|uniref:hypothetical protein n=1 Tax=Cerasicoccus frondis TaxID=490090 RepID=UPI0028525316|nr:hypothetical protein [Cerasicoccus frondis]